MGAVRGQECRGSILSLSFYVARLPAPLVLAYFPCQSPYVAPKQLASGLAAVRPMLEGQVTFCKDLSGTGTPNFSPPRGRRSFYVKDLGMWGSECSARLPVFLIQGDVARKAPRKG